MVAYTVVKTAEEAKKISERTGIKPVIINGTTILRFAKNPSNPKYTVISWDDAFKIINKQGLALLAFGDYLKIVKKTTIDK